MAGVEEALLCADAHLDQYIVDAVDILEERLAPDLGGDLRQGIDFLGEGAGGDGELGCGELPVGLVDDLCAE